MPTEGTQAPPCGWDTVAMPCTPTAEGGQTPCGMSNRTFRKVLEYLPQSTLTASARHAQTSGTAGHARTADRDAHTDLRRDVPLINGEARRTVKKILLRETMSCFAASGTHLCGKPTPRCRDRQEKTWGKGYSSSSSPS